MKNNEFQLSGGFPKVAQIMLPLIFIPILMGIFYLFYKRPSLEVTAFAIPIFIVIYIVIKNIYDYADIYLINDRIIIEKIFKREERIMSDYIGVKEGLIPFTFYIEFNNGQKVYFYSKPKDILKQIQSNESFLQYLKSKFESPCKSDMV